MIADKWDVLKPGMAAVTHCLSSQGLCRAVDGNSDSPLGVRVTLSLASQLWGMAAGTRSPHRGLPAPVQLGAIVILKPDQGSAVVITSCTPGMGCGLWRDWGRRVSGQQAGSPRPGSGDPHRPQQHTSSGPASAC